MSRPLRRHALSAALSLACTTAVFAAAAHEPSDLPTVEVTASPLAGDAESLARPVEATVAGTFAPVGAAPLALHSYSGPASQDVKTIRLRQSIDASDPLRTGSYAKTFTFTLSTTTP